jgi:hypothetical protein
MRITRTSMPNACTGSIQISPFDGSAAPAGAASFQRVERYDAALSLEMIRHSDGSDVTSCGRTLWAKL